MHSLPRQAEILLALATLGTGSFQLDNGRLDRALQAMGDDLPDGLRGELSFSCGSVGLRCFELPEILNMAFYMLMATARGVTTMSSAPNCIATRRERLPSNADHRLRISRGLP